MKIVVGGGAPIALGVTEATPTIGITDYSRRVTDDYGVTTIVERGFSRRMSVRMSVPFANVDALQRQLASVRAASVQWIADDSLAWLQLEGFFKDFSLDLNVPPLSFCTLTVEGLAETEVVADAGGDPATIGSTSTLRVITPQDVAGSVLSASNVPEADYPAWTLGTTYGLGARVIKTATHRIYESAAAGNIGNDPAGGSGLWLDVGPTNRWAMFDQALGTQTSKASPITVTLNAVAVDAVALLDLVGATVRVQATGYDRTQAVGPGTMTFLDLPLTTGAITVTITGTGSVSVGTLLIGRQRALGVTEASPTAGITDYSRKDVDDFGEVTIVERAWAKRMTAGALIRTDAIDLVANRIAAVRARPALWIGDAGLDSLTIYGFFKDFSITRDDNVSKLSLSVEGLSKAAPPGQGLPAINWPDVVDSDPVNHPKPDDGATNSADPESPFGPGGTVGDMLDGVSGIGSDLAAAQSLLATALEDIDGAQGDIETAKTKIDLQGRTLAAQDISLRQMDEAASRISEALLSALIQARTTRTRLRDAGIYVDPDSGQVRISGLDQQGERLSSAEFRLNGVDATLQLKASVSYVDTAIAAAVLDPTDLPAFTGLTVRIAAAELAIDGLNATVLTKADATVVSGLSAALSSVSSELDALAGTVVSKAEQTAVDDLGIRVGAAETTLGAISAAGGVVGLTTSIRQARYDNEQNAETTLRDMLAGRKARLGLLRQLAVIQEELTTKIVDDVSAEATARLQLVAQMAQSSASVAQQLQALVTADSSTASALSTLVAQLTTLSGELNAEVDRLDTADAGEAGVRAAGFVSVNATLSSIAGTIAGVQSNLAAEVSRLDTADATEAGVRAGAASSLTASINSTNAAIGGVQAALTAEVTNLEEAIADEVSARAAAISSVSASLGSVSASVTTLNSVVLTPAGGATATAMTLIDNAGRMIGTKATNTGVDSEVVIVADRFRLEDPDDGEKAEYSNGNWRFYDASGEMCIQIGVNI